MYAIITVMKKVLLTWNGMASQQVSGGDVYVKKLIECIGVDTASLSIILTGRAFEMINPDQQNIDSIRVLDSKLPKSLFGLILRYMIRTAKGVIAAARDRNTYDVVISTSPFAYDILPAIFSKAKKRVVILFHILPERKAATALAYIRFLIARFEQKASLALINRFFDVILVGNDLLRDDLRMRLPEKGVYVAHAGIDTNKIDELSKGTFGRNPNQAVFVGRLTQQKGIFDIIECARFLKDNDPEMRIIIVGDGQDRRAFEQEIIQKQLTNITLLGYISEAEKYIIMKQSKLFIFPSYEEGWGIALAEAMYCGCLAITYELPHYRSLFGDYPKYVKLADRTQLGPEVIGSMGAKTKAGQVEFMKRYTDTTVIKGILSNINL